MGSLELTFESGAVRLAGTLTLPEAPVRAPVVVGVHGASGGTRDFFLFEHLRRVLPPHGIGVFAFDRRGSGESGGGTAERDLGLLADDVLAAARRLARHDCVAGDHIALWGFSQGGWIAPLAAARSPLIRCLALLASTGVSPAAQMRYGTAFQLRRAGFGEDVVERVLSLRRSVEAYLRGTAPRTEVAALVDAARAEPWYPLAFLPLPDGRLGARGSWQDMDFEPLDVFARVRVPLLLFYGEEDEWSPIDPSEAAWREAGARSGNADVTVCRLPGTMHHPTLGGGEALEAISPLYETTLVSWLVERLC